MFEDIVIPPADIRYRIVNQAHSEVEYLQIGHSSADALLKMIGGLGHIADRRFTVLDFGCGCSRTIQQLHSMTPEWTLYGTDIDRVAIEWNVAQIPYATFAVNKAMPPTGYPDRSFDLVYALSVFTHLDLKMEQAWLAELARLVKSDGYLYLTFNGEFVLERVRHRFPEEAVRRYMQDGFAYFANIDDGVLPDWYQTSIHSASFLTSQMPMDSTVVRHLKGDESFWQDAMLVQPRS